MISGQEVLDRKLYYRSAYKELQMIHGRAPTHTEMIMYMALILKENPIELAIEIYKLEEQGRDFDQTQFMVNPLEDTAIPF